MCEVYFENYVLFTVNATLDPGFVRASQFFVKCEILLAQEICSILVTPVA